MPIRLLLTCDDVGVHSGIYSGICTLPFYSFPFVCVSLIPFFPSSSSFPSFLPPSLSPSLHLNLTEGRTLTQGTETLEQDGGMRGKQGFRNAWDEGLVKKEEVEREFRAQKDWVEDRVGKVTHLDGHQHVHVHGTVPEMLAPVMKELGIKSTRLCLEVDPQRFQYHNEELTEEKLVFYQKVIAESFAARKIYKQHGIRFADYFVGLGTMGKRMNLSNVTRHFLSIKKEIEQIKIMQPFVERNFYIELMVHCGFPASAEDPLPDEFFKSEDRLFELEV